MQLVVEARWNVNKDKDDKDSKKKKAQEDLDKKIPGNRPRRK